jgi:hypothetical protein
VRRVRQPARLDAGAELSASASVASKLSRTPGSMPPSPPISSSGTPSRTPRRSRRSAARSPPGNSARSSRRGRGRPCGAAAARVGHVARQRPGLVERGGERDHPVARARRRRWASARRSRTAPRAGGSSRRCRCRAPTARAGGDRGGAAAGGAAGDARRGPTGCAPGRTRVLVRGAHRELVLVGLAEQRRAGAPQTASRRRSRCTAGGSPRGSASPTGSGTPSVQNRSLTASGTPPSGETGSAGARRVACNNGTATPSTPTSNANGPRIARACQPLS